MSDYNPILADKIVFCAISHLGEHEIGDSNTGPLPNAALAYVGLAPGNPWCAAFACLMVHNAGIENGPRTGSSSALVDWAKEHNRVVDVPRRGDLGCLRGDSETGFIHTVLVEHNFGGAEVNCISGNESNMVKRGNFAATDVVWLRPY